ncbi:MAG: hypothetical protein K2N64_07760 [Anaeroplasmataceae bacterium]|nr:hypothetical protein [Anaeroplasmataceae bacterium]
MKLIKKKIRRILNKPSFLKLASIEYRFNLFNQNTVYKCKQKMKKDSLAQEGIMDFYKQNCEMYVKSFYQMLIQDKLA